MRHPRPAEEIRTERLVLRRLRPTDARSMFRVIDRDRAHLGAWLPWVAKTRAVADSDFNLQLTQDAWEQRLGFDYGFFSPAGDFVGRGGLHSIDWTIPQGEFGYWLAASAQGKGLMAEALRAMEQEFFRLGFQRLEVRCDPRNLRSAKVPERLGYRLERIIFGDSRDTMVWAKLRP